MRRRISALIMVLVLLVTALPLLAVPAVAQDPQPPQTDPNTGLVYTGYVTQADKEAAAERFKTLVFGQSGDGSQSSVLFNPAVDNIAPAHQVSANGIMLPHYYGPYPNYALSPLPHDDGFGNITGGIRKFVDSLPGLTVAGVNDLGQYLPVAVADTTTFPGTDYYVIAVVEVQEKMHSDLPATTLRQYVQLSTTIVPGAQIPLFQTDGVTPILMPDGSQALAVDDSHYLGPVIVAQKDRAVRVRFYNLLPTGAGGDLFIPVDTTYMGAGEGPAMDANDQPINYTQNRAVVHLHGGHTAWISDGTPHQWITPAGENTSYPQGTSVYDVPDMWTDDATGALVPAGTPAATAPTSDPTDGSTTLYYTNQQSARLMFYHDHAFGITRLNVYAGMAAGYVIRDATEQTLITAGIIPDGATGHEIPLIIQDKTFVSDNLSENNPYTNVFGTYSNQMAFYDPTWDYSRWGDKGDLWYPHVYMTVQNPNDINGINPFGRWHYGPWFWPPVDATTPPQPNPYAVPGAVGYSAWEPPLIPGVPLDSSGMESFFDTMVVNGTVYPYLDVDPTSYRFRILNAANDRFVSLSLFQADPAGYALDDNNLPVAPGTLGSHGTEVKMLPADSSAGYNPALYQPWIDASDGRVGGLPDPTLQGPHFIQIGTEGGFLPEPVNHDNRPIRWNLDPTTFTAGIVIDANMIIAPAERVDVIVDFSQFAGKTIILYNDAPAPFPAPAPQYDYFTGAPDNTDTGGAPTTIPGYGPNTRTIMQIRVRDIAPTAAFDEPKLIDTFVPADPTPAADLIFGNGEGVFRNGQDDIFVAQAAYDDIYNTTSSELAGMAHIYDQSLSFYSPADSASYVNKSFQPKAIHDEMGAAFDQNTGRMSGGLGLENPTTTANTQNFILYPFIGPPVDMIPIAADNDMGFQIWKITHNGVDTHPIHFHLYEVQVLNRVGWDGILYPTDPNELGWKETVRISPLEDTIVAIRPKIPSSLPFDVPNSVRLLDPTKPINAPLQGPPLGGWQDPYGNGVTVLNHYVNFGWEYVWHCHILSHEEMDMMHIFGVGLPPSAPTNLQVVSTIGSQVNLSWNDNSSNEWTWTVQRGPSVTGPWTTIADVLTGTGASTGSVINWSDSTITGSGTYFYQVIATNTVGDSFDYNPALAQPKNFPSFSLQSAATNVVSSSVTVSGTNTLTLSNLTGTAPQVNTSGVVVGSTQVLTGNVAGVNFTLTVPLGAQLLLSGAPISGLSASALVSPPAQPNGQLFVNGLVLGPSGATFSNPGITLTMYYTANQLATGLKPASLRVVYLNGNTWVSAGTPVVDTTAMTVTVTLTHLTSFALVGTSASTTLNSGWNTLSTPVQLSASTNTWSGFATANGLNVIIAYSWNGTSFQPVAGSYAMTPLEAIYVDLNAAATTYFMPSTSPTGAVTRDLSLGWSFVGSPFIDPSMPVAQALATIDQAPNGFNGYTMVISPSINGGWTFQKGISASKTMLVGKGYWVLMENTDQLAGFTTTP